MALIDRVKERLGDGEELDDDELQALIDEASSEIVRRYGSNGEITVARDGGHPSVFLNRPIGVGEVEITEEVGDVATVLEEDDYRARHSGRSLERLSTGTNPRTCWGDSVEITYTPVDDSDQREEVTIKLVKLSIAYEGVSQDKIDGYSTTFKDFKRERERLLASLASSSLRFA